MSAHWYWDWEWTNRKPGVGPQGQQRGPAGTAPATARPARHNKNEPIPEGMGPERGACRKIAVYFVAPNGEDPREPDTDVHNDPVPVGYPDGLDWQGFTLKEVHADGSDYYPAPPPEYYWVACDRHNHDSHCCAGQKGCKLYKTRVQHPSGGDHFITDFKCRCFNS